MSIPRTFTCTGCGDDFPAAATTRLHLCPSCIEARRTELDRQRYLKRAAKAKATPVGKNCAECGAPLFGHQKKFCSAKCGGLHQVRKETQDRATKQPEPIRLSCPGWLVAAAIKWRIRGGEPVGLSRELGLPVAATRKAFAEGMEVGKHLGETHMTMTEFDRFIRGIREAHA